MSIMRRRKLLNAPARKLLLTFVVSAGMMTAATAAAPRAPLRPAYGIQQPVAGTTRARPARDLSLIEANERWGINE
jgi:hypothetical protein